MLRTGKVRRDERKTDICVLQARQLALRSLGSFFQTLERETVVFEIDAVLGLEFGQQPIDDPLVEVLTAEERVARSRKNLEDTIVDFKYRDIECTAAEIVNRDLLGFVLTKAVGKCRRRGLVYYALDLEAGDLSDRKSVV